MARTIISTLRDNKTIIFTSVITSVLTVIIMTLGLYMTGTLNRVAPSQQTADQQVSIKTGTSAEESSVITAVQKANPAVVSIIISKDIPIIGQGTNPLGDLFGNQTTPQQQQIGGGSGFFVSADGYIVTNKHVVSDASADYTVLTNDGVKHSAKILAQDSTLDVAILKIDGTNYNYLSFADSDTIKTGQTTIAIGNALGEFQNSVSTGVVSGLLRSIVASDGNGGAEQLDEVIQTDAAINPGNSGGPLLDIRGNVIGVNVAVDDSAENIGFALPANIVKQIADSVRTNGEIVKPYIGVRYVQITEAVKAANNLSVDYGVLVSKGDGASEVAVMPNSPASKAGIVENDIILEIDGVKIDQQTSFASMLRKKQIGQTVTFKILHNSNTKEIKVKLEKAPRTIE